MINWFKVCEIHLSLAGHFVWWTSSPSLDILTSHWTFHCKIVPEYQTFCSTFWTISRTFSCPWFTLPGQFVRRDQTHSPDICQNRPDMSGESGEFHVLWIISILIIFISCKHLCFNAPIYVSQCPHVCLPTHGVSQPVPGTFQMDCLQLKPKKAWGKMAETIGVSRPNQRK